MSANFKDLLVWRKSILFVDEVYEATGTFPDNERFGLATQIQRAAVSVASNIAEGSARRSRKDFRRFLRQSRGSIAELETQAYIAQRRGYFSRERTRELCRKSAEIDRMLAGLITSLLNQDKAEQTSTPSRK